LQHLQNCSFSQNNDGKITDFLKVETIIALLASNESVLSSSSLHVTLKQQRDLRDNFLVYLTCPAWNQTDLFGYLMCISEVCPVHIASPKATLCSETGCCSH